MSKPKVQHCKVTGGIAKIPRNITQTLGIAVEDIALFNQLVTVKTPKLSSQLRRRESRARSHSSNTNTTSLSTTHSTDADMNSKRRNAVVASYTNSSTVSVNVVTEPIASTSAAISATPVANLTSIFECPVCMDYVLPPIYQCSNGHLLCSNCRPRLANCPTCRGELGNIRNLGLEQVAMMVEFPCKHVSTGCKEKFLASKKEDHEETCEFRPYSCPCPGASCVWQGKLNGVMKHLESSHKSITTLQGEDIVFLATDINLPGAVDWVMMQSCFGQNFMLVLEKQEKFDGHTQFFAIVQLIGPRKQAENFAYRLELNGHRRRLTWEAMPRSIHEGVASAIRNSDCLVFDTSIAKLFADNGNLAINVTISVVS